MTLAESVLLRVDSLVKHFPSDSSLSFFRAKRWVKAVDGVDFSIGFAETMALVGESGCGKTTTCKLILLLERPTSGRILFEGTDVTRARGDELKKYRSAVQAVFQDPYSSLSPRLKVGQIIGEPLEHNTSLSRSEIRAKVAEMLDYVGLSSGAAALYPHEFSGGQRQRVAVARALILKPKLIILDETVSALDVSIRAQLMNLIKDLQASFKVAHLLIAHDLATVRYLSEQVAVMYLGQIVERGNCEEVFSHPLHPYTRALLQAALPSHPDKPRPKLQLKGEVASAVDPPSGCRFHTRCLEARPNCSVEQPVGKDVNAKHWVSCHFC